MLLIIIRTVIALWPFIKENVLGNREIEYLSARNRPMTLMLVSVLILFGLFVYITDHAFVSHNDLRVAENKIKVMAVQLEENAGKHAVRDVNRNLLLRRIAELEEINLMYAEQLLEVRLQNNALLQSRPPPQKSTPQSRPSRAVQRYNQLK